MSPFKIGTLFLILLWLVSGCAGSKPKKMKVNPEQKVALLVQMAEGARIERDYPGALSLLIQAEKIEPQSPRVHLVRALTFYSKKDYRTALQSIKTAHRLDPKASDINNAYGKILSELGKSKAAKKYLRKAATDPLNRNSYMAWTNLGMIEYKNGKYKRARSHFSKAADEGRNRACVAHYYLGKLELKKRNWNAAVAGLKRATLYQCGNFGQAHLALGIAYVRSKNYKAARGKFLEVNKLFPNTRFSRQAMKRLRKLP